MQRYNYDLSHFLFSAGQIGRLQTLALIPVVAGDSMGIQFSAVLRLTALLRQLTLDAQVDITAMFVPHRHIYGSDWSDFIKDGLDESVTFTAGPSQAVGANYLGIRPIGSGTYPLWVVAGYNRIFNEYWRAPTDDASIIADGTLLTGSNALSFGTLVGRLPNPWTTGIQGEPAAASREVASSTVLDIVDLAQLQASYKSDTLRSYIGDRYREILKRSWGGRANPDADERPTLIMRNKSMLSGYDVDGTDQASLGQYSGKSATIVKFNMPHRFFPEHGAVWVQICLRFPTVFQQEAHYLHNNSNPTYKEIAGDPDAMGHEPPVAITSDKYFATATANDYGHGPYGNWMRAQPNYVHQSYANLGGFPFLFPFPANALNARYHVNDEYTSVFQASTLGHWNLQGNCQCYVKRVTPPAGSSVFAGATR